MNRDTLALVGAVLVGGGLIGWVVGAGGAGDDTAAVVAEQGAATASEATPAAAQFSSAGAPGAPSAALPQPKAEMSGREAEQQASTVLTAQAAQADAELDAAIRQRAAVSAPTAVQAPSGPAVPAPSPAAAPSQPARPTIQAGGWGGQSGVQPGGWGAPRN